MTADRSYWSHRDDGLRPHASARAFCPGEVHPANKPSRQFWVLAAMLGLALLLGGSSRADVPTVPVIRPLSILFLAYGLFSLSVTHIRQYRWLFAVAIALVMLHFVHLIPLPHDLWSELPGREIILRVDQFLGLKVWRPTSMDPDASWNALYALALPLAAMTLGVQLSFSDQVRLVFALTILIGTSGMVGVAQAAGVDWHLYPRSVGATGLLANRNHQAALLALFFPLLAVAAATVREIAPGVRRARTVGWLLGATTVPLVLVTGSRAGLFLSLIAVLSILAARLYRPSLSQTATSRFSRLCSPRVFWGGIALIGSLLVWLTIRQQRGLAFDRLASANFELRWPIWQEAWQLTAKFWPIGSGVGSYEKVYQVYEPSELLRPTYSNHVHNDWLEVLMTAGLPGALLLASATGLFGLALRRSGRGGGGVPLLRRLGLIMTLLLALASVVDYPLRVPFVACAFALGWVWSLVDWDNDVR